ncbi:hypothetical protein Tcan_05433 [Toxocara canis]|uniref:Uncharacterized protein n=2 Tax=Toxocara canis TaxID=6265 RepID=A0A0B2UTT0_TOXCA|nr:hypothetical protein Tcan_05433 [Toxocara canis]VDM42415.1 unnamed protein product [Toxocara canis]
MASKTSAHMGAQIKKLMPIKVEEMLDTITEAIEEADLATEFVEEILKAALDGPTSATVSIITIQLEPGSEKRCRTLVFVDVEKTTCGTLGTQCFRHSDSKSDSQ